MTIKSILHRLWEDESGAVAAAIIGAIAATTAVGLGVVSTLAQKKARKVQNKLSSVRAARERVGLVREARRKRASIVNLAAVRGVGEASAPQAGAGSIGSQLASGLSFLDEDLNLRKRINTLTGRADFFAGLANLSGQVATIAGNETTVGGFQSIAKGGKP